MFKQVFYVLSRSSIFLAIARTPTPIYEFTSASFAWDFFNSMKIIEPRHTQKSCDFVARNLFNYKGHVFGREQSVYYSCFFVLPAFTIFSFISMNREHLIFIMSQTTPQGAWSRSYSARANLIIRKPRE